MAGSPRTSGPAVALRDARLGHGRRATLDGVTASVAAGEHVLVVGPNGAGKSTLVATLAGLLPVLSGALDVLGLDPFAARRRLHARAGHLGHGDPFYPELSARENLRLHARLRRLARSAADERLAAVGLAEDASRAVAEFSHGMRRRLGLAKALLGAPRLLLLDEPDDGLDADGRRLLLRLVAAHPEATVVLTTHHPEAYAGWAHRVWQLGEGRLVDAPRGAAP